MKKLLIYLSICLGIFAGPAMAAQYTGTVGYLQVSHYPGTSDGDFVAVAIIPVGGEDAGPTCYLYNLPLQNNPDIYSYMVNMLSAAFAGNKTITIMCQNVNGMPGSLTGVRYP